VWWLARRLAGAAARAGILHPEVCEGFDDSGRMTRDRLLAAISRIERLGASSGEILLHPGEAADFERGRYAWGYDWEGELAAVLDPDVRAAIARAGFRLGTYRDLPGGSP
jgi:predicted glycoside hydrolase/deacetylase ChbG (UPF0249 family)